MQHDGDSPLGGSGGEAVSSTIGVVPGDYQVWLRVIQTDDSQGFLIGAFIDITTTSDTGFRTIDFDDPPPDNETIHVADVNFPSGIITWLIP